MLCSVVVTLIVSGAQPTDQGTRSPTDLFWTAENQCQDIFAMWWGLFRPAWFKSRDPKNKCMYVFVEGCWGQVDMNHLTVRHRMSAPHISDPSLASSGEDDDYDIFHRCWI